MLRIFGPKTEGYREVGKDYITRIFITRTLHKILRCSNKRG